MKFEGSFGKWLRQRRKALDLTQQELADQVSYSVVTLRKIERDLCRPSKQMAEQLADVLAVPLDNYSAFISFARRVADAVARLPDDLHGFTPASNLPIQPTPFVGRENELIQVANCLTDPACRLLTLVGPGGMGKTRLALQAAAKHLDNDLDGVFFVSLAPVDSADSLAFAIGSTLKFSFYGQESPAVQLVNHLRQKRLLLVLDNFEHLLAGTPLILDLLSHAPHVKLLITSRERLNLNSEWVMAIEGMVHPRTLDDELIDKYPAMQLFVQSARRIQPDFSLNSDQAAVLRICQLVEGMPLGILLAAAWVGVISLQEIAEEIQKGLDFLEMHHHDLPARQRSLRATCDHSWKLLSTRERDVFKKLTVFRGGFTREAAQQVAGASLKTLMGLVHKSLLRREVATGRYEIHELLRQYGEEQLKSSPQEWEETQNLHCSYYAAYMQTQLNELMKASVLDEIGLEFNNILKVWSHAIETSQVGVLRAMALSLVYFCDLRIPHPDAVDLFRRAAEALQMHPANEETEICLGLMLALQAWFIEGSTLLALQAKKQVESSLIILRKYECPQEMVFALVALANISQYLLRQFTEGEQAAREGLAIVHKHNTPWGLGPCLLQLGSCLRAQGDFAQAIHFAETCLQAGEARQDEFIIAAAIDLLGGIAMDSGRYPEAEQQFEQALRGYQELEVGSPWFTVLACSELGKVNLLAQDYAKAKYWLQQSIALQQKSGRSEPAHYETLHDISRLFVAHGRNEDAVELLSLVQSQTPHQFVCELASASIIQLETTLPAAIYEAAVERGKSLNFDRVAAEFLAE